MVRDTVMFIVCDGPPAIRVTFPEALMPMLGRGSTVNVAEMVVAEPVDPHALGVMVTLPL